MDNDNEQSDNPDKQSAQASDTPFSAKASQQRPRGITLNPGESLRLGPDGAWVQHDGQAHPMPSDAPKTAALKVKKSIYGLFIMTNEQAFFFPINTANLTAGGGGASMMGGGLFRNIDTIRKACLDALSQHKDKSGSGVAQVILVAPPPEEGGEDQIIPLDLRHNTSSFVKHTSEKDGKQDLVERRIKQSLSTLGFTETQWVDKFQSALPAQPGKPATLELKREPITPQDKHDEAGDGEGGEGGSPGDVEPEHSWNLCYTTELPDNEKIEETLYTYKHKTHKDPNAAPQRGQGH